jgi:single-stranded-DNA-specific exonuclease
MTVRFELGACAEPDVACLREQLGVSDVLAQVLVRRGLGEASAARAFLAARDSYDLGRFGGLQVAARLAASHLRRGSRITVHGDYDVDGVCSTAVLVRVLRELDACVDWYLPDRSEGYGLNAATIDRLANGGTGLLITADCGITAVEEVSAARERGLDVIVSDHHQPRSDGALPDALVVHPALGGYPCPDLCATAVAGKLAQALWQEAGRDPSEREDDDSDLIGLATIADLVPLRGESRALARAGLRALAVTAKPGLRALMGVARVDPTRVDERAVGFGLAPRLNAAGRLYRADAALELILTEDPMRAAQVAEELDRANSERRVLEQRVLREAEAQLAERDPGGWAHVLWGEGWHPGVVGIVASRLVERSGRPVVMVALDGERGRGSGRSVEAFDLLSGLRACERYLTRYGGHAAAAGVEIEREHLEQFASALNAYASERLCADDLVTVERVDALVAGKQLSMELAEELALLAPFGKGNPTVSLMVSDAILSDIRPMGEGRHARFNVLSGDAHARAVAFGCGTSLGLGEGEPALATFRLEVNEWGGVSEPRLVLRHAAPAPLTASVGASPSAEGEEPDREPEDVAPGGVEEPTDELVLF